jgi:hypothetical protein
MDRFKGRLLQDARSNIAARRCSFCTAVPATGTFYGYPSTVRPACQLRPAIAGWVCAISGRGDIQSRKPIRGRSQNCDGQARNWMTDPELSFTGCNDRQRRLGSILVTREKDRKPPRSPTHRTILYYKSFSSMIDVFFCFLISRYVSRDVFVYLRRTPYCKSFSLACVTSQNCVCTSTRTGITFFISAMYLGSLGLLLYVGVGN